MKMAALKKCNPMRILRDTPMEIELFGVHQSARYQMVRTKLIETLERTGVSYHLSDVTQIEKFIEERLPSVPAIRVDHDMLFHLAINEDPETVVERISQYIIENKMQILLVPVDFSENALNAARYALSLAPSLGFRVELIHFHHPVADPYSGLELNDSPEGIKAKQLEELADRLRTESKETHGTIPYITTRMEVNFPKAGLLELAQEDKIGMIVMGTLGTSNANLLDKVFGKVSSSVATHASKPVLLIPPHVQFCKPQKMLIAFSEELVADGALSTLIKWNSAYDAHLDFVHVREGYGTASFAEIRDRLMERLLSNGAVHFSFDVRQIEGDTGTIAGALESYAVETDPDVIIVTTTPRSLIDRLFRTSISKSVWRRSNRPILVLHSE